MPAVIKAKFGLSKAAFKRALGHLMKEGKVHQEEGWTYLDDIASQAVPAETKDDVQKD
jgi:predicted RNA-binding protein (virulence factor B family)